MLPRLLVSASRSQPLVASVCLALVAALGVLDFLLDYTVSINAFYLFPVGIGAWFIGTRFGFAMAAASVAMPPLGDMLAGHSFVSAGVLTWNSAILFAFYTVAIALLVKIKNLQATLENRVRERTAKLTAEIATREELERQILRVSEHEQRRIGQDVHDILCQQLTACALSGQVLEEKLTARSAPETGDARAFVKILEDSIAIARDIARGLSPIPFEDDGLPIALEELAAKTSELFRVDCAFVTDSHALAMSPGRAIQIYRVAMEAISNAIRHGRARGIELRLATRGSEGELSILDDGAGINAEAIDNSRGLGLRIMQHRANLLGGALAVERAPSGGTLVRCTFPIGDPPFSDLNDV
jgi:signal transduction histidine kinase